MHYSPVFAPQPMHIPDGFLSTTVCILFWIISAAILAVALRKTRSLLGERQVPLMGVLAAAIFAGQMLNFSVTGGTSGHLLGGALASILLGPWPAVLVMTSVVSIQALLFQDGGILALGANIFNMAVVGVFVSWTVYRILQRASGGRRAGTMVSGFAAAWTSIVIASLACALQLAASGTSPASVAVPAMAGIHTLIGIGEGLITAGALAFLLASRPDLLRDPNIPYKGNRGVLVGGGILAGLLVVLAPLASSHPDGLEWVAGQHSFLESARQALFNLLPDYTVPGIANPALATISAGIIGVILVFLIAFFTGRSQRPPSTESLSE